MGSVVHLIRFVTLWLKWKNVRGLAATAVSLELWERAMGAFPVLKVAYVLCLFSAQHEIM